MNQEILKTAIASRVKKRRNAGNELVDLIKNKLKIKFPTKEQAIKYLKENVKSKKDIEDAYSIIPKLLPILKKSYVNADTKIFPTGFIRNLVMLVAIISIYQGSFPAKSEAVKEVYKVITEGYEPIGYLNANDLKKYFEKDDNMAVARMNILRAIKEGKLKVRGGKVPSDLKAHQIIFTNDQYDDFLYTISKLEKADGIVYLHKDTPGSNVTKKYFK